MEKPESKTRDVLLQSQLCTVYTVKELGVSNIVPISTMLYLVEEIRILSPWGVYIEVFVYIEVLSVIRRSQ